ncbi:MAG: plastocyanin/azurin family copper-binding protein [Halobacteria archaeon]|nr:plastocyanin/azurin family copper-binding protein [Halobacteria archaeon]
MNERREFLRLIAGVLSFVLSGCASQNEVQPGEDTTVVESGPGGTYRFEPESVTIKTGETVRWSFPTRGHNVCCVPEDSDEVELPSGAEPFSSYDSDESPMTTVPKGEIYEHTFNTPGKYVYVCVPHVNFGMIGTVVVEEEE